MKVVSTPEDESSVVPCNKVNINVSRRVRKKTSKQTRVVDECGLVGVSLG